MPLSHGRTLALLVNTPSGGSGVNLSTYTKEVNGLPGDIDLGDVTVAGQVGHTSYPGLQKASFTTIHTFDDAAGGSFTVLGSFQSLQQTYPTVPWGIIFGPKGTTGGFPKITCNALISKITMPIKVTDPNTFTVTWEMSASTSGVAVTTF